MGLLDLFQRKSREKAEIKEKPAEAKEEKKEPNYTFSDEDRERAQAAKEAAAIRRDELKAIRDRMAELRADAEMKRLQQQLKDMEDRAAGKTQEDDDEDDDEDDSEEDPFNSMLKVAAIGFMQGMNSRNTPPPLVSNAKPQIDPPALIDFTDEEINEIIENNKDMAAKAQKMPDSILIKLIQGQIPNISPESSKRALEILKKKDLKVVKNAKK
jgi:hypothetical protein